MKELKLRPNSFLIRTISLFVAELFLATSILPAWAAPTDLLRPTITAKFPQELVEAVADGGRKGRIRLTGQDHRVRERIEELNTTLIDLKNIKEEAGSDLLRLQGIQSEIESVQRKLEKLVRKRIRGPGGRRVARDGSSKDRLASSLAGLKELRGELDGMRSRTSNAQKRKTLNQQIDMVDEKIREVKDQLGMDAEKVPPTRGEKMRLTAKKRKTTKLLQESRPVVLHSDMTARKALETVFESLETDENPQDYTLMRLGEILDPEQELKKGEVVLLTRKIDMARMIHREALYASSMENLPEELEDLLYQIHDESDISDTDDAFDGGRRTVQDEGMKPTVYKIAPASSLPAPSRFGTLLPVRSP